jgi:hypothetical protein
MNKVCIRISAVACAFALSLSAGSQCLTVDRGSAAAVDAEVNRVYNETLDGMEHTLPSGNRAITWIPPNDSVREQIKCLGPLVVPAIIELLHNGHRSFGHYLTVRMLGWAGGPDIVPPLSEILSRPDALQVGLKREALESLAGAPADKALPVLEGFLRSEKNKSLIDEANAVAERIKTQESRRQ